MKRCFTPSCLSTPIFCSLICCLLSSQALAQERVITGKVKSSEDQSVVAGVNVVVKGTTVGTITDASGGAADRRAKFQNVGVLPTRLVYSSTEYSLNGVHVEEAEISMLDQMT